MGHTIGQPIGQPMALPITVGMPQPKPKPKYYRLTFGLWSSLKNCRASLRSACHRRTADANSLQRTNQLKSEDQPQNARAVGEA
jgi:hypothetical protein